MPELTGISPYEILWRVIVFDAYAAFLLRRLRPQQAPSRSRPSWMIPGSPRRNRDRMEEPKELSWRAERTCRPHRSPRREDHRQGKMVAWENSQHQDEGRSATLTLDVFADGCALRLIHEGRKPGKMPPVGMIEMGPKNPPSIPIPITAESVASTPRARQNKALCASTQRETSPKQQNLAAATTHSPGGSPPK